MDLIQLHIPNFVSFQLVTRGCLWKVVDCYIMMNKASTLEYVVEAIRHCPRGVDILITGYFNVDLAALDGQ